MRGKSVQSFSTIVSVLFVSVWASGCSGNIFHVDTASDSASSALSPTPAACSTEAFPISRYQQTYTRPWFVITDSSGNFYYSHSSWHVVLKVSPSGRIIKQFGVFGSGGSGTNQLNAPLGMALDSQDRLWVAEQTNRRVHVFNSDGSHAFYVGAAGAGAGQFGIYSPATIRMNQDSTEVMISDYGNSRINVFDSSGNFLREFGSGHSSSNSSAYNADFSEIAVAEQGLYVVKVFDAAGSLLRTIGSGVSGATNADFNVPAYMTAYSGGWIIPDLFNNRVQIFDSSGAFVRSIPIGDWAWAVSYDEIADRLYVGTQNQGIKVYQLDGTYIGQMLAYGTGLNEVNQPVLSDVHPTNGKMLIADRANHRVKLMSHCGATSSIVGTSGSGSGQLSSPEGAFFVGNDKIAVVDSGNSRVQLFDLSGNFLSAFGSSGSADGQFTLPKSGLYNLKGQIVVLEQTGNRVQVFTDSGVFVSKHFTAGSGTTNLSSPQDISQMSNGHYLIADTGNHRIQEYDEDFVYVRTYGSGVGVADGQLSSPTSVTSKDGEVFITDGTSPTFRVSVFTDSAVFSRKFGGQRGFAPGMFYTPAKIRFDYFGKLLVSEPLTLHRVQKINPTSGEPIANLE